MCERTKVMCRMIHAKWMLMAAGLALLTACSSGEGNSADTEKNDVKQEATSETASETKEESAEKEAAEAAAQEKAEEEAAEAEAANAEPLYRVNPENSSVEAIADANPQAVLLTIDDAPDKQGVAMAETLK